MTENYNINLEKAILKIVLTKKNSYLDIVDKLRPEHFVDHAHRKIFEVVVELSDKGFPEINLVISFLSKHKSLESIGGETRVLDLLTFEADTDNIDRYIEELIKYYEHQELVSVVKDYSNKVSNVHVDNVNDVKNELETAISNIGQNSNQETFDSETIVKETMDKILLMQKGELNNGLKTGYNYLDKVTSGFQKGELIILAARPSMGKTALALNMANNIAKTKNVLFFSLEMPREQLIERMLSLNTKINSQKFKQVNGLTDNEKLILHHGSDVVKNLKLHINDNASLNINQLRLAARKSHKKNPLSLIIIDYLQLLTGQSNRNENRQQEVSNISRTLKALAREIGIPIIALAQLSRSVEKREDKRPIMSDLRESGAIEQDADLILFLYRESYYNHEKDHNPSEITNIIIAKNRNGGVGSFELAFNKYANAFSNVMERE